MSRSEQYEERALLQTIAQGDPQAFSVLVSRYWNIIYSQALVYVKSSQAAQDIVQDVFMKIWEKRQALPEIERFDAFLFIIARNHIISGFRKKIALPLPEAIEENVPEESSYPDDVLACKELQEVIASGIELLPSQQRTAFLLSREEGLTYDAVAIQMGLSRETVKKHIGKALQFLRQYVRAHADITYILLLYFLL